MQNESIASKLLPAVIEEVNSTPNTVDPSTGWERQKIATKGPIGIPIGHTNFDVDWSSKEKER